MARGWCAASPSRTDGAAIVAARAGAPFATVEDLWRRSNALIAALEHLANADAFRPSLGLSRREAIWAIRALRDEPLPLFAALRHGKRSLFLKPPSRLSPCGRWRPDGKWWRITVTTGLTLREHPVAFLRPDLAAKRIVTCAEAGRARDGRWLTTAGVVLVRLRPGSAKGVLFITIEDETGIANLVIWPKLFQK